MFAVKLSVNIGLMLIPVVVAWTRLVVVIIIESIIVVTFRLIFAEPVHHPSRRYCVGVSLQQEYWTIGLPFATDV